MGGLTPRQTVAALLVLAALVALGFVYVRAGSPDPSILFFGFAFVLVTLVFLRILTMFLLDLVQYGREGWNFDQRPPRADMRIGRRSVRKLAPRTIMWIGYPLFLLAFGGATLLLGLQVFGFAQLL